jgi:hypothetical protein
MTVNEPESHDTNLKWVASTSLLNDGADLIELSVCRLSRQVFSLDGFVISR